MDNVSQKVNELHDELISSVTSKINSKISELHSYQIVWKQLQDVAVEEIQSILEREFPDSKITIPKSKSTYPDLKLTKNHMR
jgi:hypothetical protein